LTLAPEELESCCAAAYASAAAGFLLGDSFHPGGTTLTSRLIEALRVGPDDVVVDVGCGPGTSAVQLARETGCSAIGVDLAVPEVSPHQRVRFMRGDAESLPLADASVDGALCECALCTFPDKPTAVGEFARVLRPGARVAIADVTATPSQLPIELRGRDAWVACVGDARPLDELVMLLRRSELQVEHVEAHDGALERLLDRVAARLQLAHLLAPGPLHCHISRATHLVAAAHAAVGAGALGYAIVVARKP
jgi:SAM-dependent methyltransferase